MTVVCWTFTFIVFDDQYIIKILRTTNASFSRAENIYLMQPRETEPESDNHILSSMRLSLDIKTNCCSWHSNM